MSTAKRRVVVAATPAIGHVRPLAQVAVYLAGAGHDVVMTSGAEFAGLTSGTGVDYRPLPSGARVYVDDISFREPKHALDPGPDQLNFDFTTLYAGPLLAQHQWLQGLLTEDTVLVCDCPFTGAWPTLLGAPGTRPALAVGVGVNPMLFRSDDADLATGPVSDDVERARAAHRAANAAITAVLEPTTRAIEEAVRTCGADGPVPFFFDGMVEVWDVAAQLCLAEFEFPRRDTPPSLRYVGPVPPPTFDRVPLPSWWSDLDDTRPVILVTQGTVANEDVEQLIGSTMAALADEDCWVVGVLGRELEALRSALPANARVAEFIPFGQILPRVSAMVTNGGYGAVGQALAAGVPLVVAGDTEEKPFTAARVAYTGAGVDLHTGRPSPAQLREAVAKVMHQPSFRQNARRLATLSRAHDALAEIETMVSTGRYG